MHWIHKLLAAACLFFAGSQAASAAVVVIKFSGTVYNVTPSVASRFSFNDVVTGTVRLKTGATGQVAGSTVYIYPDAILNGLINVAGYIAPIDSSATAFVTDNEPYGAGFTDRFIIQTFSSSAKPVNSLPFYGLFLNWQDNSGTATQGYALPLSQTALNAYGMPTGAIDWVAGDARNRVTFMLNEVRVLSGVPEPTTWALMIAGIGLIGAGLRQKRLRQTKPQPA